MPRTKQVRKRNSSMTGIQEDFLKQATVRLNKVRNHFDELILQLHNDIDMTLLNLPPEFTNLTLGELSRLDDFHNNENINSPIHQRSPTVIPPTTVKAQKKPKRQTAVSTDDGYATETNTQQHKAKHVSRADKAPSASKRPVGKSKRSSSASEGRQRPRLRSSSRAASTSRANKFQTPAPSRNQAVYNPVTPKVKPNTPMSMLRIPRAGEMALSMQGSPLLVSAVSSSTANVNVPLHDGNIISLLPNDGLRMSTIPDLDEVTIQQLQTLKSHIEKVIGNR